ncbi:hypothetical protein ACWGJX_37750 [Streptomyces sp. NPDC054775]
MESGIPFGWVTADEVYGQTSRIRVWLEEHDIPHVLAVPKSSMVMTMEFFGQARAHQLIGELPDDAWTRLSCGDGAHGPREYDWAAAAIRPWRREGWDHWLMARRSLTDPEVRRLLATVHSAIAVHQTLVSARALRWSHWRRRHQAVARRCHYQRRQHTIEGRPGIENTSRQSAHYTHPNRP